MTPVETTGWESEIERLTWFIPKRGLPQRELREMNEILRGIDEKHIKRKVLSNCMMIVIEKKKLKSTPKE